VKIGAASPLMQFIENEDEVLAKDVINISNESKSTSDESSSDESHVNTTTEFSRFETHLYPINPSAISQVPFLQDELQENFATANGMQTNNNIQSYGILSAFNLPWLAGISFHKPDSGEQEILGDLNLTVSGELFESSEEVGTTILNIVKPQVKELAQSTIKNFTTPTTVTTPPSTTTKKVSTVSTTNLTAVVSTTESIKEKLIEKIAEIAAEPIILTQGVR
jgi:hypothetical protein